MVSRSVVAGVAASVVAQGAPLAAPAPPVASQALAEGSTVGSSSLRMVLARRLCSAVHFLISACGIPAHL